MLLAVGNRAALPNAESPDWASEWFARRRQRSTAPPIERAPVNSEAQQERARRREQRISDGINDLDRWLQDLVRVGLAEAAARPWSTYEQMSARLVDAQAPGLARFVRDLGSLPYSAGNWPERMLIDVGQLSLLLEGWRRLDALDPPLQAEIRSLVGISEPRETVLARAPVHDVWDALGRRVLEGERMRVQRTWLWGQQTKCWALLLDFSVAGQPIEQTVTPGVSFEADVCFYSGAFPLRAIVKGSPTRVGVPSALPGDHDVASALTTYAEMLGRNPWLERVPLALHHVIPRRSHDETWWLVDERGRQLRADGGFGWQLLAISGGQPIDLFGEWDGFTVVPLSILTEGRLTQLKALVVA
jgi:hypothetical protein